MKAIDLHNHVVPRELVDAVMADPARYKLQLEFAPKGETISRPGKSVPLTPEFYDADAKVEILDQRRLDIALISPSPQTFFYWLDTEVALEAARIINDGIAKMVAKHPSRLRGAPTLPLQDVDAAIAELDRVKREYDFPAVELGTSVGATQLGDPKLRPVLRRLQEHRMFVFTHPYPGWQNPWGCDAYYLPNFIGNPLQTVIMVANLMFSGALDDVPDLKWVLSHGGGHLPYQLGRLVHGQIERPEPKKHTTRSPYDMVKQLWFDSITHNTQALRFLIDLVGAEHVVIGTDATFDMGDTDPVGSIDKVPGLTPLQRDQILGGNALKLLGEA